MSTTRNIVRGTTEYINVSVSVTGVTLNAQPVSFSFDKATWHAATWIGDPGTTRTAQLLLTPAKTPPNANNPIYVLVTDSPEIPELRAGNLYVED